MRLTIEELNHIRERRINYSALIVPKAYEEIMYLRNRVSDLEETISGFHSMHEVDDEKKRFTPDQI